MFHLTLMPDIKHLFEGFSILRKIDKIETLYSYPKGYSLNTYFDFIFPCDCPKEKTEEYIIVISNNYNSRSFIICRYSDFHKVYLCIYSYNPWFEILSKLLINLCSNEFLENHKEIGIYLSKIYNLDDNDYVTLPACNLNDKTPQELLKCTLKHPFIYDKYIQEYQTAINPTAKYNKQLWIEVFWSMLLERPVLFMSKRYQKLTSSLMAAIFFIHPLSWLHKIVSIIPKKTPELLGMNCCMLGIHDCMEPILGKADYWNEALLVDLDKGESRMVGGCEDEKETAKRFKVPKYIKKFFAENLQIVDESVSKHTPDRIRNIISNVPWDINNKEERMYNEYKKGFHIYSLLFRTVIAILIGHYRQCISDHDGHYKFDRTKFIGYNGKISGFLELLVNSQCFDSFIEDKLKIIENNEDLHDRFDRERLELNFSQKPKSRKHKLEKIPKKIVTVINAKSEEDIRKKKNSTMPNLKKNRITKIILKNSSFSSHINAKAPSLSSSASSLNSVANHSKKKNSDCISTQSESLTAQILNGLVEQNILPRCCIAERDSLLSNTLVKQDTKKEILTPNPNYFSSQKATNVIGKAPDRPLYPPLQNQRPTSKPTDTKVVPQGRVKDMIQKLNDNNLPLNNPYSKNVRETRADSNLRQRSSSALQISSKDSIIN